MMQEMQNERASVWSTPLAKAHCSEIAFSALIGGMLMLFVGFFGVWYDPQQETKLLSAAAVAFNGNMRGGGAAMLVSAFLCFLRLPFALMLDAVLTALVAILLLFSGGVMLQGGYGEGFMQVIFALMFFYSAKRSRDAHRHIVKVGSAILAASPVEGYGDEPEPVDVDRAESRAGTLKQVIAQKKSGDQGEPLSEPSKVREKSQSAVPDNANVRSETPPPSGFLADLGRDDRDESD